MSKDIKTVSLKDKAFAESVYRNGIHYVRYDMSVYKDFVTIAITARNLEKYIIQFNIPAGNDRKKTTERTDVKLKMKYDEMKIHLINTDDEYVVWDTVEKAITKSIDFIPHDIDGFTQLIKTNLIIKTHKKKPRFSKDAIPKTVMCYSYIMPEASSAAIDFANAVALKAYIINDNRTDIASYNNSGIGYGMVESSMINIYQAMSMEMMSLGMSTTFAIMDKVLITIRNGITIQDCDLAFEFEDF